MERLAARRILKSLYLCSPPPSNTNTSCGLSVRYFTQTQTLNNDPPKNFFSRFMENFRTEIFKDKEMTESLKKFRQEREKLEDIDQIKQARQKFKEVEEESLKEAQEVIQSAKQSIRSGVKLATETEIVKKTMRFGSKISSTAKGATDEIWKQGEYIKASPAFKTMSSASKTVEKELSDADILSNPYEPPETLLKRSDRATFKARDIAPNEQESSVDLHKDSKWAESWKKFKDNNPYFDKVFEYKARYDESDNPLIRVTRGFVDKMGQITGGLFQTTDISNVLTEICKVDSSFDLNSFLKECEKVIVPTILESMIQNRLDVLSDWCHEAVFNVLSQQQKEAQKLNMKINSRILDIQNFELVQGKMMEQGPVLIVSFQSQQITYVTDAKGNVVEGDPEQIIQYTYVMAFCRDQSDLDPNTAWKLIDVAMQKSQFAF